MKTLIPPRNLFFNANLARLRSGTRGGKEFIQNARRALEEKEKSLQEQIGSEPNLLKRKWLQKELDSLQASILSELRKEQEILLDEKKALYALSVDATPYQVASRKVLETDLQAIDAAIQQRSKSAQPYQPRVEAFAPTRIIESEIEGLKSRQESERDLVKRGEIQRALQELEAIKQPIATDEDLHERIDQIQHLNGYIDTLERGYPAGEGMEVGNIQMGYREDARRVIGGNVIRKEREALPEDIERERVRAMEIRNYQTEHIQTYLRKKREELQKKAGALRKNLDPTEQQEIDRRFGLLGEQMERSFADEEKKFDLRTYREIQRDLEIISNNLDEEAGSLYEPAKDKDNLLQEARNNFLEIENRLRGITPEQLNFLEASLSRPQAEILRASRQSGKVIDFSAFRNTSRAREAIALLRDREKLQQQLGAYKNALDHPDQLSLTELREDMRELAQTKRLLDSLGDMTGRMEKAEAETGSLNEMHCYQTVRGLVEKANNPEITIDELLKDPFFKGHVERLPFAEFKRRYGKRTNSGMVFYRKGHVWKIIMREPESGESRTVAEMRSFRSDLIHELRHLEFDSMPQAMKQAPDKTGYLDLVLGNPAWPAVRKQFMDQIGKDKMPHTAPDDAKPPYNWPDEEIAEELYAMDGTPGMDRTYPDLMAAFSAIGGTKTFRPKDTRTAEEIMAETEKAKIAGAVAAEDEIIEEAGGKIADRETKGAAIDKGVSSAKDLKQQLTTIKEVLQGAKHSPYLGLIPGLSSLVSTMLGYADETGSLVEKYERDPTNRSLAKTIGERVGLLDENLPTVTHSLEMASGHSDKGVMNPFQRLWLKTSFLSIDDIMQVAKDVAEYTERRYNRKKADHAAKLGSALFAGTALGSESKARMHKAEEEEVNEWKGRYEKNIDAWELKKIIKRMAQSPLTPNKDEVKAILRILADKGRIDWFEHELWEVLNKLQNKVFLDPNDPILAHSPNLVRTKLHRAIGEIWDYDEYPALERNNEHHYESHKKEFIESYNKIQSVLTERMQELYQVHLAGGKVDPAEYEAAIEYSIIYGKAYAEASLFYLMAGMARGILDQDRGMSLDKYLNQWPATQWIYSHQPPYNKKDYIKICEDNFATSYKTGECKGDFKRFYWTQVQNDPMTVDRVRKSVSERKWDHDWTRVIACLGDANTAKLFLQGRSAQQEVKDTAVENTVMGILHYLEENARDPTSTSFRQNFTRQFAFFAMFDGICEKVAYRDATAPYGRYTAMILGKKAREAPITNHDAWVVRKHRDRIRELVDRIDPVFFGLIRDGARANTAEGRRDLAKRLCDHLDSHYGGIATRKQLLDKDDKEGFRSVNNVFENMDEIMGVIMTRKSDAELVQILKNFNDGEAGFSAGTGDVNLKTSGILIDTSEKTGGHGH